MLFAPFALEVTLGRLFHISTIRERSTFFKRSSEQSERRIGIKTQSGVTAEKKRKKKNKLHA